MKLENVHIIGREQTKLRLRAGDSVSIKHYDEPILTSFINRSMDINEVFIAECEIDGARALIGGFKEGV